MAVTLKITTYCSVAHITYTESSSSMAKQAHHTFKLIREVRISYDVREGVCFAQTVKSTDGGGGLAKSTYNFYSG